MEVDDIALSDISDRVAAATVQLAGPGVNIVSNPLHLEINAGLDQYNLDIIDLPGIVANPTGGEFVYIVCGNCIRATNAMYVLLSCACVHRYTAGNGVHTSIYVDRMQLHLCKHAYIVIWLH